MSAGDGARPVPRSETVVMTNMCMIQAPDGRVLVQHRVDPGWPGLTFPGGHVEPCESFTAAVIREIYEETGLTIRNPDLVGIRHDLMAPDRRFRYMVFLYRTKDYTGTPRGSAEGRVEWLDPSELTPERCTPGFAQYLELFLNPGSGEILEDAGIRTVYRSASFEAPGPDA